MRKTDHTDDPLLDRKGLAETFPLLPNSPNHLRRMEAFGFPPAIKISERRKAWRKSAVQAYLDKKEAEANACRRKGRRNA